MPRYIKQCFWKYRYDHPTVSYVELSIHIPDCPITPGRVHPCAIDGSLSNSICQMLREYPRWSYFRHQFKTPEMRQWDDHIRLQWCFWIKWSSSLIHYSFKTPEFSFSSTIARRRNDATYVTVHHRLQCFRLSISYEFVTGNDRYPHDLSPDMSYIHNRVWPNLPKWSLLYEKNLEAKVKIKHIKIVL